VCIRCLNNVYTIKFIDINCTVYCTMGIEESFGDRFKPLKSGLSCDGRTEHGGKLGNWMKWIYRHRAVS